MTQRVPSANLATPLKLSLSLQALTRELRLLAEITQQLAQNIVDLEKRIDALEESEAVLGLCPHGVDLDHDFCPHGCRV